MSFATDFSAIAGSVTDGFSKIWTAVNAPAKVPIPAVQGQSTGGNGVGSALQKAAGTTSIPQLTMYILLGAAGVVLVVALVLIGKKK